MKLSPTVHDCLITFFALGFSTLLTILLLSLTSEPSSNVALIYTVMLICIAQHTAGYFYGIISALLSVICINYLFTYPYLTLNFTLKGYPTTFIIMLIISLLASTTTSHIKAQNKLLAEKEKLLMHAEKEKMRANLLRAISHDFRTPLTSIMGSASSCLDDEVPLTVSEEKEMLRQIYSDASWLLNLVENLLSITRIQNTGQPIKKQLELVEEVISDVTSKIHKRHPNLQLNITIPTFPLLVPMDPVLIEQVLLNLLDNAYLHAQSTEPLKLVVTTDNLWVTFHIIDYGIGIDSKKLATLFDGTIFPNATSSDGYTGMGIGLSICKTIIDAHHGTLMAKNHHKGSEFTFSLPKEVLNES